MWGLVWGCGLGALRCRRGLWVVLVLCLGRVHELCGWFRNGGVEAVCFEDAVELLVRERELRFDPL